MKADIVAGTSFYADKFRAAVDGKYEPSGHTGSDLIEASGRLCYLSWHRPNPETASVWGYIKNILRQRHFSVLEHANVTILFQGVSRSLTHQLIRHRHFSVSEVSQRFVDAGEADLVIHPAIQTNTWILRDVHDMARQGYEHLVEILKGQGLGRKQAREAARTVLTGLTETKIVVTGNYRTWRHFINMRGSEHADAEIRLAALVVARILQAHDAPAFQDVIYYTTDDGINCVKTGTRDDG